MFLRVHRISHILTAGTVALLAVSSAWAVRGFENRPRVIPGEVQQVGDAAVSSWARLGPHGDVREVGVTVPISLFRNPPGHGDGPAGSFVVLPFPEEVKEQTFLNHFEMHWEEHGHPPIYQKPHFDLHFYGVPVEEVWAVTPPDPVAPAPARIPAGYVYPGVETTVPEMGTHALNMDDFTTDFVKSMVLGYYNGELTFVEPMVTQEYLLRGKSFQMNVPVPEELGRNVLYPTRFQARYDHRAKVYHLLYDQFVEKD